MAYTRHTIVTPAEYKAVLEQVRQNGFAVDNEEREEGLRCIAAPIRDHTGQVIAGMSVAGPAFRLSRTEDQVMAKLVMTIAAELSAKLGYVPESVDKDLIATR